MFFLFPSSIDSQYQKVDIRDVCSSNVFLQYITFSKDERDVSKYFTL